MKRIALALLCAAFGAAPLAGSAFAAAPANLDVSAPPPPTEFQLNTVMVVHDWILCVSQPGAETIARARAESVDAGEKAYADLAAQKQCGRFKKLGVMLEEPLYRPAPGAVSDARVYAAQINIGVGWQNGFVVTGDPPQE